MSLPLFFVTGSPKSGTTWLGKLLDAHPEISCKGEACFHAFTSPLERITKEYNDLLRNRAGLFSDTNDFPLVSSEELFSIMRYFVNLRMSVIADPDKPRLKMVGEKDPAHAEHFQVLNKLFPESKIIHIIRDGRAVVLSAWHNNLKNNTPGVKEAGFDGFLVEAAKQWGLILRRALDTAPLLGERYMEIRYEDLIKDTPSGLKRVLAHLGRDCSDEIVEGCVAAASFEKLSKGRAPGQEDTQSFFRKGVADDWKNHMTPSQIQRFNARSGGMLEELGYLS